MGREGPCFNCGIKYTPLWRSGPPAKPVLCNACGSRWRLKGSFKDYTPKHVTSGIIPHRRKPVKVARYIQHSDCIEDNATNRPWSGSSSNCIEMGSINGSDQSTVSNRVSKRKRTMLLTPMQKFQWELYCLSQKPEFSKLHEEEENNLIYYKPSGQMPNEIGFGAFLLKPPPTPNN